MMMRRMRRKRKRREQEKETEELLVRELHHARQVQGLQMPFATDREHAHALQHATAKAQPCQAVLRCQSWRTDGLEAPRLEIFVWGAPQRRARHFQRTLPSEHAQSLPRPLGHGHFNLGQNLTRSRRFTRRGSFGPPRRRCLIFVLMLSSDQSGRDARISRGFRPSTSHWRS